MFALNPAIDAVIADARIDHGAPAEFVTLHVECVPVDEFDTVITFRMPRQLTAEQATQLEYLNTNSHGLFVNDDGSVTVTLFPYEASSGAFRAAEALGLDLHGNA